MAIVVSADEAVARIPNGATVLINPMPAEKVFAAFGRRFEATGNPVDLTVVWAAGLGPFSSEARGMNHFAYPKMAKRFIAAHYGLNHRLVKMVANEEVEAYNLPQGVMTQLYREIAAGRPGLVTKVGLGTFVDPRLEGGKVNKRTQACEDIVDVITINGEEYLLYKSFHVDVGVIRGTSADPEGNISAREEGLTMESFEVAMAARNCGGIVIAQVDRLQDELQSPHDVIVPGLFVDFIVVAETRSEHPQTLFVDKDPRLYTRAPLGHVMDIPPLPMSASKVIARRALLELRRGATLNLGVGIPMDVAAAAHEEGMLRDLHMSTEVGVFGGLPEGGKNFGPAKDPSAIISQPVMFDFYDGGGLDFTCVGLAQADAAGNVNVSKLGPKVIGCGGFINITQSAKCCIFCGEFTAGGPEVEIKDGKVVIVQEGKVTKFVEAVDQITFSGKVAREKSQPVLFVTERCVFRLMPEGMVLAEIAPGIDIERDILPQMKFRPIVPDEVPLMDARIFQSGPMNVLSPKGEEVPV